MLTIYFEGLIPLEITKMEILLVLLLSAIVPITFHVLRAIGLYKLAKRKQIKGAFLAWIPSLWIYVVCKLVAENRFFKTTIGKLAVLFTVICAVTDLLMLAMDFLIYFPIVGNYLLGREIHIIQDGLKTATNMVSIWEGLPVYGIAGQFVNPYSDIFTVQKIIDVLNMAYSIFDLAKMVIVITALIGLFKKYWPQHFVLATVLSLFFGIDGPFIFAIRNKEPVNYMDYLRSRYQGYGNPYGHYGPQGQQGPFNYYDNGYNAHNGQSGQNQQDAPFEEFEEKKNKKPDEPFSDF